MRYMKNKKLKLSRKVLGVWRKKVLIINRRVLGIFGGKVPGVLRRRIISRRSQGSDGPFDYRLGKDHIVIFWILLKLSRVVDLLTDGVATCRDHWQT